MDERGAGGRGRLVMLRLEVDRVGEKRPLVEQAEPLQSRNGIRAVPFHRSRDIDRILRQMDVTSRVRGTTLRRGGERLVRHGEAGVHTEHPANPGVVRPGLQEPEVLLEPGDRLAVSVAIGDLVAQDRGDAGFLDGAGDRVEAAPNT